MYIQYQPSLQQHRCLKSFTFLYNLIKLELHIIKKINLVYYLHCKGFLIDKRNVPLNQYKLQGCFRAFLNVVNECKVQLCLSPPH